MLSAIALLVAAQARLHDPVVDIEGHRYAVASPENLGTVFFFIATDCPIANAYSSEINRIIGGFSPKRFQFFVVYEDPLTPISGIREHAKEYHHTSCPVIFDRKASLAVRMGATITPEAVVVGPHDEIAYRGRIDDRFAALGVQRAAPSHRDLVDALNLLSMGRAPVVSRTKAIGCFIVGATTG